MAIFQGEDMVDVTTPDGRTLTLPRSLAAMSQQGALPEPPPVSGELPSMMTPNPVLPPSVTGMLGDPQPTSDAPVQNGDDYRAGTVSVPTTPKEQARSNAAYDKTQAKAAKAQAAQAASPQGQISAATSEQTAAAQAQGESLLNVAYIEAAEQDVVGNAVAERNKQLDVLFQQRDADAQKNAAAEEAKLNEVMGVRKKIEGTKIDRTADHPVILAIMAGLAGLGAAMNGKPVDTLDIIYRAIDRKVAAQTADLDQMGKVYGLNKDELAMLKEKSKSKLEFHSAMIAAETEKAVRHIEEITARTASEKTKANAKGLIADLRARSADKTMEATRWGLDFDQKDQHQKQQIRAQNYATSVQDRHNKASEQLQRENMYLDYQQALAADKAKGDELTFKARTEADKEVRQLGVKGANNEYLMSPQGRQKMEQAAQFEAEAAQIESNPDQMARSIGSDKVALLKQKASILRGDARSFDVVKFRNDPVAARISDKHAAAQTMMDTVDEITMLYDQAGRGLITQDKLQAELQAKTGLLSVAAKDAWQLGAWDKGSAALVSSIIGQDPSTEWNVGVLGSFMNRQAIKDPEAFKNRLKAVTTKLEQDVNQQIMKNTTNWDGKGALFTRKTPGDLNTPADKAARAFSQARTGVELEKDAAQVGVLGKINQRWHYPLSGSQADAAQDAQSLRYPGLSKAQDPQFDSMLKMHKAGDKTADGQLIGMVGATATERPDLAAPLLRNLREHASAELYAAARATVPKGSALEEQMSQEENNRIGAAMTPGGTPAIAAMVLNTIGADGKVTDHEGRNELVRRSEAGDSLARKALLDIVHISGVRKTAPGSVFGGGK